MLIFKYLVWDSKYGNKKSQEKLALPI